MKIIVNLLKYCTKTVKIVIYGELKKLITIEINKSIQMTLDDNIYNSIIRRYI